MAQPPDTSKDTALRSVGRTIVNFQRLEHNLKLAAQLGPLQGTVQKIQRDIARRQERAGALTLGQAIQAWLAYCDGTQAQVIWTPDLFDVSIQMTFSLESDAEARNAHAKALRNLLDTRNDLIHTRLAKFQWESPDACDALVLELNAVNANISEQLDYVTHLFKEILALQNEAAEAAMAELSEAAVASTTGGSDA
jgi:hypothetical protein